MNTDLDDFKEWVSTYVAKSTSGDYASAIRTCDRFAKERGLDVLPLETCRDYKQGTKTIWAIKSHPDFGAFNKSSHQRNNSALSYFERFLEENKP